MFVTKTESEQRLSYLNPFLDAMNNLVVIWLFPLVLKTMKHVDASGFLIWRQNGFSGWH